MISNYYGKKVSVAKIREYSETNLYGTSIIGMITAGEILGLNLEAFELDNVNELNEIETPIIAHIINEKGFNHYIVIKKIENKYIHIIDPALGHYNLTLEEFKEYSTGVIIAIEKSEQFTRESLSPSIFKFYFEIFKKNQNLIWIILCTSVVINLITFVGALYFKVLVDNIIPSEFVENLNNLSIAILLLYLISLLTTFLRNQLILDMSLKINKLLMLDYYYHILHLPLKFFETRKEGEILSRFRDTDKIRDAFSSVTVTLFIDVIMIIVGSIILFIQSPTLFYIILCLIPIYILLAITFKKPFETFNRQEMELNADLSSSFIEGINGVDTIKSYNSEKYFFGKTNKIFDDLLKKIYKLGSVTNIQISFKDFMSLTSTLIILWVGSYQVISNNLTLGELLAFNALFIYYIGPIERLIESQSIIQSAIVSTRRVLEIINLEKEYSKNEKDIVFKTNIRFENVSFGYDSNKSTIEGLNFDISKGKKIGLVGQSGSGKSTIVKLLLKYYSPDEGNIYIDDKDIDSLNLTKWREKISYVSQYNFIFYGTILENIVLNHMEEYSLEKVIEVCKVTGAHDFIMNLPAGYHTMMEAKGENLSGGEIQRISIARALYKNAEILILDEPTSALDYSTEIKLKNYLEKINSTVIVVSHRLNLVANFDKILTFRDGKKVEVGNHEDLLKNKGLYYKLWENKII